MQENLSSLFRVGNQSIEKVYYGVFLKILVLMGIKLVRYSAAQLNKYPYQKEVSQKREQKTEGNNLDC